MALLCERIPPRRAVQEYNDMYDVRIGVGVFLILSAFFALRTTLHQVLFDKVEVSPSWSLGEGW